MGESKNENMEIKKFNDEEIKEMKRREFYELYEYDKIKSIYSILLNMYKNVELLDTLHFEVYYNNKRFSYKNFKFTDDNMVKKLYKMIEKEYYEHIEELKTKHNILFNLKDFLPSKHYDEFDIFKNPDLISNCNYLFTELIESYKNYIELIEKCEVDYYKIEVIKFNDKVSSFIRKSKRFRIMELNNIYFNCSDKKRIYFSIYGEQI